MTLTLHLSPELEQRLKQEAMRQGLSLDAYALQLLAQSLPAKGSANGTRDAAPVVD